MARRNISLPDDLDEQARRARLNVSALAQRAVVGELERRRRMAALDAWLDELDAEHGPPPVEAFSKARAWLESAAEAEPRPGTREPPGKGRRARRAAG